MPTYEYRCKDCGEHIEVVQSFADDPLDVCPNCDGQLRKVFSPIGITFKGSGFYRTDSRKGSSSVKAPKESVSTEAKATESSGGSKDSTGSSDSKSSGSSSDSKSSSTSSEAKTA